MTDVERLFMQDESNHRWHVAHRYDGGEPELPDACNIQGSREYWHELPEDVEPEFLCKRCFGSIDPAQTE